MFKNQKIKFRILLGYSVPLLLFILAALVTYASLNSYNQVREHARGERSLIIQIYQLHLAIVKYQRSARGYILVQNDLTRDLYNEDKENIEKKVQEIIPQIENEEQKRLLDRLVPKITELIAVGDKIVKHLENQEREQYLQIYSSGIIGKKQQEINELSVEFEQNQERAYGRSREVEKSAMRNITITLGTSVLLVFVLSIIIALLITRGITKHISGAINSISSTSLEMAATVNQHERIASHQSSMTNETTTTIQELGASSRQTSDQALAAADIAQNSLIATDNGAEKVRQELQAMKKLEHTVGMVADQILKLGEQTAHIGNLANIIRDLSGEINMLALNAAVEAARAGEHGKGFAVVAGEVRKLANQSKRSAERANKVIADIQKSMNATILKTEEGTKVVEEVTGYAEHVSELFESLTEGSNKVFENVQQVMLNAKQQSTAVGQIVEAMNGLNTGARETAAGIVQTKAGIEQLNSAATNLKQML